VPEIVLLRSRPASWRRPLVLGVVLGLLALGAAYLFYERYYRWTFNELGNAYDPETHMVYTEQAGCIWGGCFAVLLIPAVACVALAIRRRRMAPTVRITP